MTVPASPTDELSGARLQYVLMQRQVVADLIADQGVPIQLLRYPAPTPDEEGGYGATSPTADPEPQEVVNRLFMYSLYEPQFDAGAAVGYGTHEKFVLIGPYDDDILENDFFYIGGHLYKIGALHPDRSYQVKAEGEGVTGGSYPDV